MRKESIRILEELISKDIPVVTKTVSMNIKVR